MIGIDTNILLHALNAEASEHDRASRFLESLVDSTEVVIVELVLVELYVLLRNPAVFSDVFSAEEAVDIIQSFRSNSRWKVVENAPVMKNVWKIASEKGFARRKIFDLRLALTLQHHGVKQFATANVKDFKDIGFDKVWNPLLEG